MKIIMDMGTTNTRIHLCDDKFAKIDSQYSQIGASATKKHGNEYVKENVKNLIKEILLRNGVSENEVEYIAVSGMGTSELGIYEVEHLRMPYKKHILVRKNVPEISDIPFVFIPGVKKCDENGDIIAMMRGEETEATGIFEQMNISGKAAIILPGTHNEILIVDNGRIVDFVTTMSGELIECIMNNTILKGNIEMISDFSEEYLWMGAKFCEENGFNSAILRVRTLSVGSKINKHELSSFYFGALLCPDVFLIKKHCMGLTKYIGGKKAYKNVFSTLLSGEDLVIINEDVCNEASFRGAVNLLKNNL